MIPFGFELLAKSDALDDSYSGRILQVIIEITRAIGSQGGQCTDMGNGSTRMVGEGKGGELHACGAACGGNTRWWERGGNRKIKKIWILRRDSSENVKNEGRREK